VSEAVVFRRFSRATLYEGQVVLVF
jgi:hypothetical protein